MTYVRIEKAGRLERCVLCSGVRQQTGGRPRGQKQGMSSEARQLLNVKTSKEKLERLLAANFDKGDLYLTLTYRDACLPSGREEALNRVREFVKDLRDSFRIRTGRTKAMMRYVYCSETVHGEGRWHHHMMLRADETEVEDILACWAKNGAVDIERFDGIRYAELAAYMTKEPKEPGCPRVGERMWSPSHGLAKPVVEKFVLDDHFTLTIPKNATIIEQKETHNQFGDFVYRKYLLP